MTENFDDVTGLRICGIDPCVAGFFSKLKLENEKGRIDHEEEKLLQEFQLRFFKLFTDEGFGGFTDVLVQIEDDHPELTPREAGEIAMKIFKCSESRAPLQTYKEIEPFVRKRSK